MSSQKFEWSETISCPLGYPIDVYMGGLQSQNGEFTSLYLGTHSGNEGWGSSGRSMSSGFKTIPNHLHVIWISYAERQFYEVDTDIDREKMLKLFKEGYYVPSMDNDHPQPRKEDYNQIIVGFAPGGVIVVWVAGAGRQVEIGRYEGKKTVVPQEEIDALSPGPQKNMFDPEYQRKIMYEFDIVPLEVVKANEGKPIPYGLWDKYREKYNWQPLIELPNNGVVDEIDYFLSDGEKEFLFGNSQAEKYKIIPQWLRTGFEKSRGIPKKIYFNWYEDKEIYECSIYFDYQETSSAFEQFKDNNEIQIKIRVNELRSFASVQLFSGNKSAWLKNCKIKIN